MGEEAEFKVLFTHPHQRVGQSSSLGVEEQATRAGIPCWRSAEDGKERWPPEALWEEGSVLALPWPQLCSQTSGLPLPCPSRQS